MNLYQQANKVRNAGARYAPGDTELIHATPEEKAILKLLGGSGEIDPETGLPHYREVDSGGGGDGNESGSQNSGNEGRGGYGGGGRDHDGGSGNDNGDGSEGWGDNWNDPENEAYARGATPGYGESVSSKAKGGNWALGGAGLSGGTLLGGPKLGLSLGKAGWNIGKGSTVSGLGNTAGWNSIDGKAVSSNTGTTSDGSKGNGGSYWASLPTGTTGNLSGTTGTGTTTGTSGTSTGMTTTGSSIFPSIYTDPVTGRILNTASASSESNQQLLDQIMGTSLASTPLENASTNPLLQQINSGLMARVGNENIDNTVANTMKANEDTMARRGMGMLASPLQDQVRASLGLSTAQARNANNLAAQESNWKKQADLLSFLKTGQTADTATQLGLADLENQRKIAEITAALQEKLANKNLSYLKGVQNQNNTNSWINTAGDVLGSIDWGSLFS